MASTFSTEGLASVSARHPWKIILGWNLILVVAGAYALNGLGEAVTTEIEITEDVESVVGVETLRDSSLADIATAGETIVIRSFDGTTVDDPAFAERTTQVVAAVRELQAEWSGEPPAGPPGPEELLSGESRGAQVLNYYELIDISGPVAGQMVSEDRTVVIVPVSFDSQDEAIAIQEYIDVVERFDGDRFDVTTVGSLSINEEFSAIAADDLIQGEMIGIPIAIFVLIFVFGALMAPALPLILGLLSIGITLGLVTLVGQVVSLQLFIENMVTMLGLAIGIDYSLFIVERYREQRRLGYDKQRAIELAGATSGKAVLFSGATVILALLGVMIVPLNIFFSLSMGAILVVAVAVALTLTLLPAMLSLLGDRVNWPSKTPPPAAEDATSDHLYSGFWGKITRVVVARPMVSLIIAVTLLLVLALPALDLETGFTGSSQMPPGEISDTYDVLEEDFSAGLLAPVTFVFEGEHTDDVDQAIAQLQTELGATGGFAPFSEPVKWDDQNQIALLTGTMVYAGSSEEAYSLIENVRDDIVPATMGEVDGLETWVAGQSAAELDMLDVLRADTVLVFAFVLSLSFVLLTLAFRSIVVPIQAIIFNLLSVGATWGILVLVFSKGFLRDFFGFTPSPVIESWAPILLFCILFGLSMDYHVFILSRIREHYDVTGNNSESVAVGLRSTGKIITGAALIMVVIFGAFSTGSMLALQQLGFGLAVAVFLDATIVRTILVPSLMTLLGDRNWYLPSWLAWLPNISIEGEDPEPPAPALIPQQENVRA